METIEKKGMVRESMDQEYTPGVIRIQSLTEQELKDSGKLIFYRRQMLHFMEHIQYCKAELMQNCIMGTLAIPDKKELLGKKIQVGYYVDGDQLLLIGSREAAGPLLESLKSHELRSDGTSVDVLVDLLNLLVDEEVSYLQHMEERLSKIEEGLLTHIPKNFYQTVIRYRKQLLVVHAYYAQLINMTDVIQSNHNEMLSSQESQRLASYAARVERLHGHVEMLREYVLQIREMYQTQIDVNQNHTMNLLTVVTSLFLPLSLLVGWYGMNFVNMPELRWRYGYIVLILLSILILFFEIRFFKKKGLL